MEDDTGNQFQTLSYCGTTRRNLRHPHTTISTIYIVGHSRRTAALALKYIMIAGRHLAKKQTIKTAPTGLVFLNHDLECASVSLETFFYQMRPPGKRKRVSN